jgi:hypothetical protein
VRIHNLKAPEDGTTATRPTAPAAVPAAAPPAGRPVLSPGDAGLDGSTDRHGLEIALLKAQIQHLELVIETARSLMGANQERLLRRLHEQPREMVELTLQLRRLDAGSGR